MTTTDAMPRRRAFLAAALLLFIAAPAVAESWQEPAYNPPIGSRWILRSTSHTVEVRGDGSNRESDMSMRSELAIEAKTADRFRVTLVMRDVVITGDPHKSGIEQSMVSILKDVVMHGRLDAKGAPVAIDNLEEVRGRIRSGIDGALTKFADKPKVAAVIKQLLEPMLNLQGKEAAKTYLGSLPQLALYQNTGLKPGEVRTSSENVVSPMGNMPIKSNATLRIGKFDAAGGHVHYLRERSIDPESLKTFGTRLLQQLGAASDKPLPPEAMKIMQSIKLSLTERADIDVEGGMTRTIQEQSSLIVNALGHTMSKNESTILTVVPAP